MTIRAIAAAIAVSIIAASAIGGARVVVAAAVDATPSSPPPAPQPHAETPALYAQWGLDPARLPYPKGVDAAAEVARARERARRAGRFLMVTFGANWCADCRALHQRLHESPVREYAQANFEVVAVDVGDFDRNLDVAQSLGVGLDRGIPVAIFYARDGRVIGATRNGELEPARHYTSRQILTFLQDVAREGRIAAPR